MTDIVNCIHCGKPVKTVVGQWFHIVQIPDAGVEGLRSLCHDDDVKNFKEGAIKANGGEEKDKGLKKKTYAYTVPSGPRVKGEDDKERPRILVLEALSGSGSCIIRAGGISVELTPYDDDEIDLIFRKSNIHGLLLTGGGDVNPRLYHRKPHKKVYGVSDSRDYAECLALDWARELNIPVMGICRGSQIMNVEAGGTLWQDVGGHYGTFGIAALDQTHLFNILQDDDKESRAHATKHLHHQAVKRVAPGFRVAAVARDRTIEAIESEDGRCIGVQFHPEMKTTSDHSKRLFRWLVCEAARRAGMEEPEKRAYTSYAPYVWGEEWGDYYSETKYEEWKRLNKDKAKSWSVPKGSTPPMLTTGIISYPCAMTDCEATFPTQDTLVDHMVCVHGETSLLLTEMCALCTDTDADEELCTVSTGLRVCQKCLDSIWESA